MKEATSIFELASWKFKLDQVDDVSPNACKNKKCRMDVHMYAVPQSFIWPLVQHIAIPYLCKLMIPIIKRSWQFS